MIADEIVDYYIEFFNSVAEKLYGHTTNSPRIFLCSMDMQFSEFSQALRNIVKGKHLIVFVTDDEEDFGKDNPRGSLEGSIVVMDVFQQGNPTDMIKKQKECRQQVRAILKHMKRSSSALYPEESNLAGSLYQNKINFFSNSVGSATPPIANQLVGWRRDFTWTFPENIHYGKELFV